MGSGFNITGKYPVPLVYHKVIVSDVFMKCVTKSVKSNRFSVDFTKIFMSNVPGRDLKDYTIQNPGLLNVKTSSKGHHHRDETPVVRFLATYTPLVHRLMVGPSVTIG